MVISRLLQMVVKSSPYSLLILGIPITLLMLSTVGEEMLNCQKYIIRKIETGWLKKQEVSYLEVKCLISSFATILFLILAVSIFSVKQKGWTFLDSLYCWFITFTTVGFGDFNPVHGLHDFYDVSKIIALAVYILFGLCAMSNLLNIAGELASQGIFKIHFVNKTDTQTEVGTKANKNEEKTYVTWV